MLYEYALTIPANTSQASPATLDAALAPGIVVRVGVQFPSGCVGLVHVQIWRGEHQVWPGNLDGDISAEGQEVAWAEDYDLNDEPLRFSLRGWNLDDSYPHKITFRFALLSLGAREEAREHRNLLRRIGDAIFGSP